MKDLYDLRVAKVISEREIVLNAGEEDDVKQGMTFLIYTMGDEVIDPETKEKLGQLEIVKGSVRVTHVQSKMSTAQSNQTMERRVPNYNYLAEVMRGRSEYETVPKPLTGVEVGDRVKRIS